VLLAAEQDSTVAMKTAVFSDVHLDATAGTDPATGEFVAFLKSLETNGTRRIVILGDLFDFWFEYRHVIFSGYFEVLRSFAALRDLGVEIHLVCGNHDFWAGRFLRDELRFIIHPEPTIMDFGGRRALLVHGDGLNARDRAYRLYKWLARARPVVWLFGLLHPDLAMAIAKRVSRSSRQMSKTEDPGHGAEALAIQAYAQAALAAGEADIVMCGHSHVPVIEEHPTPGGAGLYINTGEWMNDHSYVEWDGTEFRLLRADEPKHVGS